MVLEQKEWMSSVHNHPALAQGGGDRATSPSRGSTSAVGQERSTSRAASQGTGRIGVPPRRISPTPTETTRGASPGSRSGKQADGSGLVKPIFWGPVDSRYDISPFRLVGQGDYHGPTNQPTRWPNWG